MINLNLDDTLNLEDRLAELRISDRVLLSGTIFTARDAAHKELKALIDNGQKLPYSFVNGIIYYAGPTETPPNAVIGSIGPTTSSRMDSFSGYMKILGVKAVIGKGERGGLTKEIYARDRIVYFIATGGCGALLASRVKKCDVVAFDHLGCESVKKLYVEDFPVTVALDLYGGDIFYG